MEDTNKKDQKKEKPLYAYEHESSVEENAIVGKYYPHFKLYYYIYQVIYLTIPIVLISVFAQLIFKNGIKCFIIMEITNIIVGILTINDNYKRYLETNINKRKNKTVITEFYKDYLTREIDNIIIKVYYNDDIIDGIETTTHIFLRTERLIIPINKNHCDLELIEFIRPKINKLDSRLGDKIKFKSRKKAKNPEMLKKITNVLFILTIICLLIAVLAIKIFDIWAIIFFLPIPLISLAITLLIKNKRYSNVQIDYKTNLVCEIVVTIVLLVAGFCFYLPLISLVELKPQYTEIAQTELPTKTYSTFIESLSYYDEKKQEKWTYKCTKYNIGILDAKKLEEKIKSSDVWVLNPELDSSYINDRPIKLKINKNTYVLNYNSSTKKYNEYSKKDGQNLIITYDSSTRHIEIHDFYYRKKIKKEINKKQE